MDETAVATTSGVAQVVNARVLKGVWNEVAR
jgi:hypothetical protein